MAPATPARDAERLLAAMAQVRRVVRRHAHRPLVLSSLTGSQVELARVLRDHPGVSVGRAAEILQLAPNSVSTLVRQLLEAGILVRRADPHDRRAACLDLTPAARHQLESWRDRRVALVARALERLAPGDRRTLASAIEALEHLAPLLEHDSERDVRAPEPPLVPS